MVEVNKADCSGCYCVNLLNASCCIVQHLSWATRESSVRWRTSAYNFAIVKDEKPIGGVSDPTLPNLQIGY